MITEIVACDHYSCFGLALFSACSASGVLRTHCTAHNKEVSQADIRRAALRYLVRLKSIRAAVGRGRNHGAASRQPDSTGRGANGACSDVQAPNETPSEDGEASFVYSTACLFLFATAAGAAGAAARCKDVVLLAACRQEENKKAKKAAEKEQKQKALEQKRAEIGKMLEGMTEEEREQWHQQQKVCAAATSLRCLWRRCSLQHTNIRCMYSMAVVPWYYVRVHRGRSTTVMCCLSGIMYRILYICVQSLGLATGSSNHSHKACTLQ
jgi:hypothetical protein